MTEEAIRELLRRVTLLEKDVDRLRTQGSAGSSGVGMSQHANEYHTPDMALASDLTSHIGLENPHGTDFEDLGDTPANYTGHALKLVRVNAGETGLEFTAASASLTVREVDLSPSVSSVTTIEFSGATVTDQTGGVVRVATSAPTITREAIITFGGTLTASSGPFRVYNQSGGTRTITKVALGVAVAPTGQAVIVDIHKSGTTIFTTQANRPQIAAGANSGSSTSIDVTSWAAGEYLTADVDQIGSGVAGEYLVVHVFYTE